RGILAGLAGLRAEVLVFPPFPLLPAVVTLVDGRVQVGAQNLSHQESGAYTGEVSGDMLKDVGCNAVLVGHSERRALYGEDDALVAAKFERARKCGLTPFLCVGETLDEREAGATEAVVARQLDAVIARCGVASLQHAVLAYEPVWAIGTGRNASPAQAQAVHAFLRSRVHAQDAGVASGLQILYGGSVKASNASELFAQPDIDGGLVGGASLKADEFLGIIRAAEESGV
ncbi:MAG TPA: triose-phosphate isomerase, partial [Acidiferrobacteraceae bacterium]|nr:triose-phosphate isomerase [Acidiferrobacteraceae bacterium]